MKKNWRERELTMEVVVGAFMVMIFLGLGYFTIILSNETWFRQRVQMEVSFPHVMGLSSGDPVVVRGMPVGKVRSLDLVAESGNRVHVMLSLNEPIELYEDYRIMIMTTSILGGRQLEIFEGSPERERVTEEIYQGSTPSDLMADASRIVSAVKDGLIEGGVIANIENAVSQITALVDRVHSGKGTLGRLLAEDDTLYEDVAATVATVRTLAERIESGKGTLGALLSEDDQLYRDLGETAASINRIMSAIDKGEGLIGKLVRDETLYDELKAIVSEARAALDDLRETVPVTTFGSVLFGAF